MRAGARLVPVVMACITGTSRGAPHLDLSAPCEGLESLLVKMGRMGPLAAPCRGTQAGMSRDHLPRTPTPSCPIILGRPFLRAIGAIIDMKEGNIRLFLLRKGMEQFPRKKIKLPYESIMRATYGMPTKDGNT